MRRDHRWRAACAALALGILAAACSPEIAPPPADMAPRDGGRFVFPLRAEPATLDFVDASDQFSALVTRLIGDSLVDFDADLRVVPRLAESWEFSADGKRLTFRLREGVKFHDGVPLTADDVVFTWRRIVDPRSHALAWLDGFLPIDRVVAPDARTVQVTYREPYAPALQAWAVPIQPRHLCEQDFAVDGPCRRAPIGSGPFRFGSWEAGRRVVLHANTDYWAGRPHLDSFVFQVIPSQETTLQALLAGEIDYAPLTPVQWSAYEQNAAFARRFDTVRFVPLFFYYIAWRGDGSNPFFSDPAVRRALAAAFDRDAYIGAVWRGRGRATRSLFHPAVLPTGPEGGMDPGAGEAEGPEAAARLLDEAGWRLDPSTGVRVRQGVEFRFTLLVFGGGEDHVMFSQVAQESLRQVGVAMAIERLDWATLRQRLADGSFQAALSGIVPGADPDDLRTMLHSSQLPGGRNYAAFRDARVDAWLDEARRTIDPDRRRDLYLEVDRRTRLLQPYTPLFYPLQNAALSRRFGDVVASPRGILDHYPGAAKIHIVAEAP